MKRMRRWIEEFSRIIGFPDEGTEVLLSAGRAIEADAEANARFCGLVGQYERDLEMDYAAALRLCGSVAKDCGVSELTVNLLLFVCLARRLRERYRLAGYPDRLWRESMLDLRCKLYECHKLLGIWGSFVAFWFPPFFTMERFAFGRLQFEPQCFGHDRYRKDGRELKRGESVLAVHVPSMEAPLTPAACDDAFSRAAEFFRAERGMENIAFYCGSWLLYSANRQILPPGSNILAFAARFDIFAEHDYDETNDDVLWRVFNVQSRSAQDVACFPTDTALRRGYARRLQAGGKTGWAEGVFFYDCGVPSDKSE